MTELHDSGHRAPESGGAVVRYLHPQPPADTRADEAGTRDLELADQPEPANRPPGTELVLDESVYAELVDEEQDAVVVAEDEAPPSTGVAKMRDAFGTVVKSDRTVATSKAVGRHAVFIAMGAGVVVTRWWEHRTRYQRYQRAAEVAGDREAMLEWEQRAAQAEARRHKRRAEWPRLMIQRLFAVGLAIVAAAVLLVLLGIGLAMNKSDSSYVFAPLMGTASTVGWLSAVAFWLVSTFWVLLVAGVLAVLHRLGRRAGNAPTWAAPKTGGSGDDRDVVPDEGAILNALKNLDLAPLNRKFKDNWRPRWVLGTGRDGKGWRTQLELPPGVTVEMILNKKDVLAHNLVRLPVEVWPTEPRTQPGVLDLWVADQGLLTGPVEPWPLLTAGAADFFKGVPVGIDQRGSEVTGKLMACNYAIAGIMGSGKTSLVIELMLGAMLDPLVELDAYVMAFNADYDPMEACLRVLMKGDEDEHVEIAMDALRALRSQVSERGKALADLGGEETKVTRALAEKHPELRPRLTVFDECQELFRHERYGEEAKQLAIKVMMKSRKCALPLIWVTPAPSADSLPRDLAKTVSHRVCFAIGDHQGNDAILGTGAHRQGITATTLVPGEDIGTAMASGFAARPGLLRTHHIRKDATVDEITPVVKRAYELRQKQGMRSIGGSVEKRDLLADVAEVLGDQPTPAADVPALLAHAFPAYSAYRRMTGRELAARLTAEGAKVPSTKNRWPVDPKVVREALRARGDLTG